MKVLFVCSGGMSSAIAVKALKDEGEKRGEKMETKAVGAADFPKEVKNGYDVAMVAPQIRFRFDEMQEAAGNAGVPCCLIEPRAYSPLGGAKLYEAAKKLINK